MVRREEIQRRDMKITASFNNVLKRFRVFASSDGASKFVSRQSIALSVTPLHIIKEMNTLSD